MHNGDRCIMDEILPTSGSYSLMNRLVRNLTAIAKPKTKQKQVRFSLVHHQIGNFEYTFFIRNFEYTFFHKKLGSAPSTESLLI